MCCLCSRPCLEQGWVRANQKLLLSRAFSCSSPTKHRAIDWYLGDWQKKKEKESHVLKQSSYLETNADSALSCLYHREIRLCSSSSRAPGNDDSSTFSKVAN